MADERSVPVKTILVTIGLVLASLLTIYVAYLLARILALLLVAAFFAIVVTPLVDFVKRRLHLSKGLSTTVVFLGLLGLLIGMLYMFIRPLVDQTQHFVDNFPQYVSDAKAGRGPVGGLVKRYKLDERIEQNQNRLEQALRNSGDDAVKWAGRIFAGFVSTLTVVVLAILMVLYGPDLLAGGLGALSPPRRERVKAVATDCARALTGYVMGNLLISVVAGTVTYVALTAFGVPFREVLALFVAFADLIPLVGATLGAVPTIFVAFLHSTTAGIGMLVVYIVYQQFENHVLQVAIMSKTVHINQLVVLVSVLMGAELFGILGALLAIPVAGVVQVIARDLWDHRRGKPKEEPTIGEDEVPVTEVLAEEADGRDAAEAAAAVDAEPPAARARQPLSPPPFDDGEGDGTGADGAADVPEAAAQPAPGRS